LAEERRILPDRGSGGAEATRKQFQAILNEHLKQTKSEESQP